MGEINEVQCREVFAQQIVAVSDKQINLLEQFFKGQNLKKNDNGEIELSVTQASELRWHAISYLNSLEAVLVAWQYSVIDREIIERQFSYLFRPEQGHAALKYFLTTLNNKEGMRLNKKRTSLNQACNRTGFGLVRLTRYYLLGAALNI